MTVQHSLPTTKQGDKYYWGPCIFCVAVTHSMMFVTVSSLLRTSSLVAMLFKFLHTDTEGVYIFLICTTYCGLLNNIAKLIHESHACYIRVTLVVVSNDKPCIVSCYEHHPFWNTVEKFISTHSFGGTHCFPQYSLLVHSNCHHFSAAETMFTL